MTLLIVDASTVRGELQNAGWAAATPQHYLEKIFTIPFLLPAMTPASSANSSEAWRHHALGPRSPSPTPKAQPCRPTGPTRLHHSPRPPESSKPSPPLLGILSGFPDLLMPMLVTRPHGDPATLAGLRYRKPTDLWTDFVAGLQPQPADPGWANQIAPNLDEQQLSQWRQLIDALQPANTLLGTISVETFQKWLPHVARFSFHIADLPLSGRPWDCALKVFPA